MFKITIYLMACAMATVMGVDPSSTPVIVNGLKYQCQARGDYLGACSALNINQGEFTCDNLMCAKLIEEGVYEAVPTGPVLDYTACAKGKVCKAGKCERVGPAGVPPQLGPGPQYSCRPPASTVAAVRPQVNTETAGSSGQIPMPAVRPKVWASTVDSSRVDPMPAGRSQASTPGAESRGGVPILACFRNCWKST
ncbi:uncharacterized protein [Venturia canescens]|uniref:uncharacterized protein isoform X2 n=1 Tax=Venturia canescens TaxID=32260 RepID=UPI001C9CE756|nr:uncharacterized protein LOC122410667 isoform X2 [Venturia canescens]